MDSNAHEANASDSMPTRQPRRTTREWGDFMLGIREIEDEEEEEGEEESE